MGSVGGTVSVRVRPAYFKHVLVQAESIGMVRFNRLFVGSINNPRNEG